MKDSKALNPIINTDEDDHYVSAEYLNKGCIWLACRIEIKAEILFKTPEGSYFTELYYHHPNGLPNQSGDKENIDFVPLTKSEAISAFQKEGRWPDKAVSFEEAFPGQSSHL